MQLSRALFLSSERTRYHGACFVSVAASMASRAREYSYQRRTDSKSIWLSLLSVVIGSSRNPTSSYQMLGLFFFTIPNPNWDKRDYRYYPGEMRLGEEVFHTVKNTTKTKKNLDPLKRVVVGWDNAIQNTFGHLVEDTPPDGFYVLYKMSDLAATRVYP